MLLTLTTAEGLWIGTLCWSPGASVQYRLKTGTNTVATCLSDCKSAVRYLRRHAAELGVDRDNAQRWIPPPAACLEKKPQRCPPDCTKNSCELRSAEMTAVAVRPEQAVLLQEVSTTMVDAHVLNHGGRLKIIRLPPLAASPSPTCQPPDGRTRPP